MRVAIIGAGITGLYLAWKLSEKGHKITVFEKKERIGQEVCSGLFSKRILDFVPESRSLIQNKINFVLLHFPKKTVRVNFSKEFFVISHLELDRLVAKLAEKQGAKLLLNHNIRELPRDFDRIIGCDGASSFVRKKLGLPEPKYRLGILGVATSRDRTSDNFVEAWSCQTGFSWKIPRGNKVEYGVIAQPEEARLIFDNFQLEKKARIVPQGFIIPSNSKITLCGDAAGLTKAWSGGGVVWGLTSAKILLKTFPDFIKYKKAMKRFFLPKVIFSKTAIKVIYFLGFKTPWLLPKKIKIESDFLLL